MSIAPEARPSGRVSRRDSETPLIEANLAMSTEAFRLLTDLAQRTDREAGQVILLALFLFKTAIEASEQGQHFGVAETSDALDLELVGF